jgi:hypothetical protein
MRHHTSLLQSVLLQNTANAPNIEVFLRPGIEQLFSDEKLDESDNLEHILSQIRSRSLFMFLWEILVTTYLMSDFLTPKDCYEAIANLNVFGDLKALYVQTLQMISISCKGA